jgi:hypothetical protein
MFFMHISTIGFIFCNQRTFCTAFMRWSWFLPTNGLLLPILLCIGLMIRRDHFYCILVLCSSVQNTAYTSSIAEPCVTIITVES